MRSLRIRSQRIDALKPNPHNARTHSKKQIGQIAASIEEFGFNNPVLIADDNMIMAGHGRVEVAKLLGLDTVPTIRIDGLTPEQIRAYVLADNQLALKAGWDPEILAIELGELTRLDLDFDVTITGFEMAEIDILVGDYAEGDDVQDPDDDVPPPELSPAVTRPGDIWIIGGKHRLICGDATDPDTFTRLLDGKKAQMVFTDPPYNVPIDGHVSGLGKVKHREFAMATGEMTQAEFEAFLTTVFSNLATASQDGALHYVCIDWRHLAEIVAAGAKTYSETKNVCVWNKTNAGMGSFYRSKHELVFVFKHGRRSHINNVQLGCHGRYRTNVWDYAGANTFGASRDDDLAMHPTVKPVALVADAIMDASNRSGVVLDAFAGSGSTLVAAARTGRRGYGVELDPYYCDVIVRRLAKVVGLDALHSETESSFADMGDARRAENGADDDDR
jgi:DNA modification methylase